MTTKKLRVVLEVEVSDLSPAERRDCAEVCGMALNELPRLEDADLLEIADAIKSGCDAEVSAELFAGSDLYVKTRSATVKEAEWVTPDARDLAGAALPAAPEGRS